MKTLYLMRHAKSSWDFPELSDHDRPLNKRGRKDAPLMGQQLLSRDVQPDLILTSTAVRALTTATLVAHELNYDLEKLQTQERIYKADKKELQQIIKEVPDEIEKVLLVGHNYPISELANLLSPEAVPEMPTAAVVALRFDCETWLDISADLGELLYYDFPKNYKNKKKSKGKNKHKDQENDKDKDNDKEQEEKTDASSEKQAQPE